MQVLGVFFLLVGLALGDNICDSGRMDAAFSDKMYSYFFRDNYVWQVDVNEKVVNQGPINNFWPSAPQSIDAAAYRPTANTVYLFSGEYYWKYTGDMHVLYEGYPKLITDGFHDVYSNLDAAIVWPNNNHFYFLKGDQYIRRDTENVQTDSDQDATPIDVSYGWQGIPANINAMLTFLNGFTYMFKGDEYYLFNRETNQVMPGYPRKTLEHWFNCSGGM